MLHNIKQAGGLKASLKHIWLGLALFSNNPQSNNNAVLNYIVCPKFYSICGDINVNYFAKDTEKIADYMNNLAMIGCKMKINNHTKVAKTVGLHC